MLWNLTYAAAKDKAEHLKALGETTVHIDEKGAPWHKAEDVECGGSFRLNGPTGCYIIARDAGLTFKWSVDFEKREANGASVSLFDRDRLRDIAMKLPPAARQKFADLLVDKVLPPLEKRTQEIRDYLNQQHDSEDCVRGLIAFASAAHPTQE